MRPSYIAVCALQSTANTGKIWGQRPPFAGQQPLPAAQGQHTEAETLLRSSMETDQRMLGPSGSAASRGMPLLCPVGPTPAFRACAAAHPDTLWAAVRLAACLDEQVPSTAQFF
jgi:hypothetical protein